MSTEHSIVNLLTGYRVVLMVENQAQLLRVARMARSHVLLFSHGNLFDFLPWLQQSSRDAYAVYIDIDHMNGVHADATALRYLAEQLHVAGIV